MITVRPATYMDAVELEPHLRRADLDEIKAASGSDPLAALVSGLKTSEVSYAIVDEAQVLALGGVVRIGDHVGSPWLLGSEALPRYGIQFLRMSRPWVRRLNRQYPVLTNFIDARNTVHLKWLEWLDFKMEQLIPEYGVERRPFFHFVREQNV